MKSPSSRQLQGANMRSVSVQREDFDIAHEVDTLKKGNHAIGAIVTFTGTVRDTVGTLESMTLEHYPGMTEKELDRIAEDACRRWALQGVRIIHRYGDLYPGDNIVLVITASSHRHAAFEAADYMMDFLKSRATFWKKETTGHEANWVDARESDTVALKRWET